MTLCLYNMSPGTLFFGLYSLGNWVLVMPLLVKALRINLELRAHYKLLRSIQIQTSGVSGMQPAAAFDRQQGYNADDEQSRISAVEQLHVSLYCTMSCPSLQFKIQYSSTLGSPLSGNFVATNGGGYQILDWPTSLSDWLSIATPWNAGSRTFFAFAGMSYYNRYRQHREGLYSDCHRCTICQADAGVVTYFCWQILS